MNIKYKKHRELKFEYKIFGNVHNITKNKLKLINILRQIIFDIIYLMNL